jgi:hypothetical protein
MPTVRKRFWVMGLIAFVFVISAATFVWVTRPGPLTGPWRGQIVDAETLQPLEGAVVLALWDKRTFGWPHPDRNYHDIDEVVSDTNGRFVIPARDVSSRHPFELMIGPEVTIFKGGYGHWRFQGAAEYALGEDTYVRKDHTTRAWKRFAGEGVVILLPRIKTTEERRTWLTDVLPNSQVPAQKLPRMERAWDQEAIRLGLEPRFRKTR